MPAASFIMIVCWFFARLGTPVMSTPRAASAFMRSADHSPMRVSEYTRASCWRSCGSSLRPRSCAREISSETARPRFPAAGRRRRHPRATRRTPLCARRREAAATTTGTDPRALEQQRRVGDGPAVVDPADQIGVVDDRIVEEHLVEQRAAVISRSGRMVTPGWSSGARTTRYRRAWARRSRCAP